jgi:hypothetical protein
MAMAAEKLAYFRAYREANREAMHAARKRYHQVNGRKNYYENIDLTRAIKRKAYHVSRGNLESAQKEQDKVDQIRLTFPRKRAGVKPYLSGEDMLKRRKAVLRKSRYKHVQGLPVDLTDPEVCEICGGRGKMCLDHCHENNVFRGWLCDDCNIAIGRVKENVDTLKAMIEYIQKGEMR